MASSFILIAIVGLAVGAYCFFSAASNWERGLRFTILALFFGGIIGVNAGNGGASIVFRDIFIVLPLYLGFFSTRAAAEALGQIPPALLMGLLLLAVDVLIAALVPTDAPLGQLVIGGKVWLYYLPFLVIGVAVGQRPAVLTRTMRFILITGLVVSSIGLIQGLLVRIIGFEAAIGLFFGSHADQVTQGFAFFDYAGGIYRIPATFTFVGQYSYFLYSYVCYAVLVANTDPEERFRTLAKIALVVAVFASAFSGVRLAILAIPGMLTLFSLLGLFDRRVLAAAPALVVMGAVVFAATGLEPIEYFSTSSEMAADYGDWVDHEIAGAFEGGALGLGVGKATLASRYVRPDYELIGVETYIGKVGIELGVVGMVVCAALALVIVLCAAGAILRHPLLGRAYRFTVPLATLIAFILSLSIKGQPIDSDPTCIFIWLSLGLIIGVDHYYGRLPRGAPIVAGIAPADGVTAATVE